MYKFLIKKYIKTKVSLNKLETTLTTFFFLSLSLSLCLSRSQIQNLSVSFVVTAGDFSFQKYLYIAHYGSTNCK